MFVVSTSFDSTAVETYFEYKVFTMNWAACLERKKH